MMKSVDYLLNRITMYRLVLYYLIALVVVAVGFSIFGYLQFNPFAIAFSAGYLTMICWLTNRIFAYVFEAPINVESAYITALILALIVNPLKTPHDIIFLTAIAGLSIASKFILAIHKKHIFNPAAIAVVLTAFGPGQSASWWVGSSYMLPFVVIGGLLIVRKIQRGRMVASYLAAVTASTLVVNLLVRHNVWENLQKTALHSSLFFLAFIMLTEPLTSPSNKNKQAWYAALAGLLFPPQIHLFSLYSTPELSLLVANIYSYFVSPKLTLLPLLIQKNVIASDIGDFIFKTAQPIAYKPGQYMEWTLPHEKPDNRGNRRHFTLASSPTEDNIRLGVKFYAHGSSYKQAMLAMDSNTPIAAGQLGGDFVLPNNRSQKLAFIAGGIGVTPYRSMIKYMIDTKQRRDVTLLYSERTVEKLVYTNVFKEAAHALGIKTVYTLTNHKTIPDNWHGNTGIISAQMIANEIPDYKERLFYISGSYSLITAIQDILSDLGIKQNQIKTDFFPGFTG